MGINVGRHLAERLSNLKRSDHAIPWATVITIAGIAGLVSTASFIREATTAREFGIGGELDALVLAFAILLAVAGPMANGLTGAIVPKTTTLHLSGDQSLQRHVWSSITSSARFGGFAGVAVISIALTLSNTATGPTDIAAENITQMLIILGMTAAVMIPIRSAGAAHLQAMGVIYLPSLSQALPPAVSVLYLLVSEDPVPAIVAIGYGFGSLLDAVIVLILLSTKVTPRSIGLRRTVDGSKKTIKGVWTLTLGSLIFAVNPVIDLIIASHFSEGTVARVGLGSRLPVGVAVLIAASIGQPMFQRISALQAKAGPVELLEKLRAATFEAGLVSTIIAAGLALFSPFLSLLLVGGDWTEGANTVTLIMCISAAGIPAYVTGSLWAQTIIAVGAYRLILLLGFSGTIINVLLDIVLGKLWGGPGIAVATATVYTSNLLAMIYLVPVVIGRISRPTLNHDSK